MFLRWFSKSGAGAFLAAFGLCVGLAFVSAALALAILSREKLAPPPPLAATPCIDGKLAFLRDSNLAAVDFMVMGSSAAWRNVDLSAMQEPLALSDPINAAPCYLYADQTAWLTRTLLPLATNLDTLLIVFHPRDFERCWPGDREIADPALVDAFLRRRIPSWAPYITGFRPAYLMDEARRRYKERTTPFASRDDAFGSSFLTSAIEWEPDLTIDPRCFEAIADLEHATRARGIRLIVALTPVKPSWVARLDPDGNRLTAWRRGVMERLRDPSTIRIDSGAFPVADAQFADPVHLLDPYPHEWSRFLAGQILKPSNASPPAE